MRTRPGIWIAGLLAAVIGGAALGVHVSSAASTRASAGVSTLDKTYSCRVRSQHFVDLYASVDLPPVNNRAQPGFLGLTTGVRTSNQGGVQTTVTQISLSSKKDSLRIDTKSCKRVKRQIPLKAKGLPTPATAVTPTQFGHDSEQCDTSARVLVRLRLQTTNHTPTHALLAVRNDNAKRKPIGFYKWSPSKVSVNAGRSCSSSG